MVPVTHLFVVLFGEGTRANEFAFAACNNWHRSARLTIELEGTAWAFRYVLLCEWGESATKFTMNVSIKTSCFRSKTPTESSCRLSRPDRSSSASRGCVHVHVPAYRWVNFGSFAKACHGKSFYSGFLLLLEQPGEYKYYSLTKNQERATLPSTTSDRQRARVKSKNVCNQRRDEMVRTWKHILPHEHFRAKYWYVGGFIEYHFQPLSVGGFFWNTEIMTCEFDMWSVTWARLPQCVYTAGMYRDNKPKRADAVLRHHCMFKNLSLLFQEPRAGVHPERFL